MDAAEATHVQTFGELLRGHRIFADLSQEALAERARISVNGISALERGIRRTPQSETLALLIEALNLTGDRRQTFELAARSRMLSAVSPAPVPAHRSANNLPPSLTAFYGRTNEIDELSNLVSNQRLVTLVGAGGIGKTRTSLEVAAKFVECHADGVWLVELAPVSTGEFVAYTIGNALGIEVADGDAAVESLQRQLAGKNALLVLDNCEHVVESAARIVAALLLGCSHLRILATSRQALGIAGERTYRLPGLALPGRSTSQTLSRQDAVRFEAIELFVDRATAADQRFALTDDNARLVADICHRLDGIALAIELAAPRVKILTLQQLFDRLDQRFPLLANGNRDAFARQQTLRALIDWSFDLLDGSEQALFRNLAVFAGGFTIDGAVAVGRCAALDEFEVFDTLASLVDKSLVVADVEANAAAPFRMLESTRAYALEKLDASAERECAPRAHLQYFVNAFESLDRASSVSGSFRELGVALARNLEDVRAALDFALRTGTNGGAAILAATGHLPWQRIGLVAEFRTRASAHRALLDVSEFRTRSALHTDVAFPLANDGFIEAAFDQATEGVAAARHADPETLAIALTCRAFILQDFMLLNEARENLDEAASFANITFRTRIEMKRARVKLSMLVDDYATVITNIDAYAADCHAINDPTQGISALHIAWLHDRWGHTQKAVDVLEAALPGLRETNDRRLIHHLYGLSYFQFLLGLNDVALANAREGIRRSFVSSPLTPRDGGALETISVLLALRGDLERSARILGIAERLFDRKRELIQVSTEVRDRVCAILGESITAETLSDLLLQGAALAPEVAVRLAVEDE